jgi:hypothetical protein
VEDEDQRHGLVRLHQWGDVEEIRSLQAVHRESPLCVPCGEESNHRRGRDRRRRVCRRGGRPPTGGQAGRQGDQKKSKKEELQRLHVNSPGVKDALLSVYGRFRRPASPERRGFLLVGRPALDTYHAEAVWIGTPGWKIMSPTSRAPASGQRMTEGRIGPAWPRDIHPRCRQMPLRHIKRLQVAHGKTTIRKSPARTPGSDYIPRSNRK